MRLERRLRVTAHSLLGGSLLDGREHASMLDGAALGIQVLAEEGRAGSVLARMSRYNPAAPDGRMTTKKRRIVDRPEGDVLGRYRRLALR
ncbi:MAG: hypothetical protein ACRDOI_44740 [Trebonia sp.]